MPLAMVREYSDRIEADVARLGLEAEGIPAVLFDAGVSSLRLGPIASARLMVDESDLAEAKAILDRADA
ncbi:putative signal transducing protein [Sphingosinicella sp.]|uniref:putative signal transducing protein n=1 Tax=Sphingosinicella sp. TaxID=1917971 RepID=UPI0035B471E0